jgi:hypothetical protein
MASKESRSLGEVWKRRRIKRVLFFTYRFDFRWFHNFVLPKIRAHSTLDTEILVIASVSDASAGRRGIGQDWGDQYEIRNWFAWENRFKVIYLPSIPIFHAKFIAIQRESEVCLGMGSSNLTRAGWETNFETWDWNRSREIPNILTTLA